VIEGQRRGGNGSFLLLIHDSWDFKDTSTHWALEWSFTCQFISNKVNQKKE